MISIKSILHTIELIELINRLFQLEDLKRKALLNVIEALLPIKTFLELDNQITLDSTEAVQELTPESKIEEIIPSNPCRRQTGRWKEPAIRFKIT